VPVVTMHVRVPQACQVATAGRASSRGGVPGAALLVHVAQASDVTSMHRIGTHRPRVSMQSCSYVYRKQCRWPLCAAAPHVRSSHGHPRSHSHARQSTAPATAAVCAARGDSMPPLKAANCTRRSRPSRAAAET
jgi:hypothetical protein